ncbi:tetratricopeptide repeat protein [[Phormidium] sp. ETS-05]|uniref:tetratricopeptide repeat protein n=1 Tax=[Phormidium] sp. ETS-05 TaxID=222819 RepID=UPI0018EEE4FB|nr:tetratricopeptide repeat protein [[Phormidium] sp. ETS-05]
MKIGIVWAGKPFYLHDSKRYRSCSLSYFQELFAAVSAGKTGEIAVYSLQKEAAAPEWQEIQGGFTQMGDIDIEDAAAQINDFADTAAVIAQLDLIITIDTVVAHLAGAMGKPVWVLLPFAPDWRWMLQREDSPWYPTMRLFRQSKPGDWQGVFAQVQAALQLLLANRDKSAAELHKLGVMAYQQGEIKTAIAYYRTGLILNPELAKTHNNLAVALKQVGHLPEAISRYRIAIRLAQRNGENLPLAEMYNNLGNALQSVRKFPEAVAAYQQALSLKPFAEAYNNLGNAYQEMGQLQDAISAYEQAISLKYRRPSGGTTPYLAEAHYNLGVALQATGNLAAAIVQYKQATAESPMPQAHINRGNALRELGRMDEAIAAYKSAIQLHPEHPDAHWNLAVTLLLVGKLREGFAEYEWRWQTAKFTKRQFAVPQWDGSPLEGKTILIHTEQGFGDTIQFSRYIPLVTRMGGKVILECPFTLVRLLQNLPGIHQIIPTGDDLPEFDCYAPLISLPRILGTTLETIPHDIPYLKVRSWATLTGSLTATAQETNEHPEGLKPTTSIRKG